MDTLLYIFRFSYLSNIAWFTLCESAEVNEINSLEEEVQFKANIIHNICWATYFWHQHKHELVQRLRLLKGWSVILEIKIQDMSGKTLKQVDVILLHVKQWSSTGSSYTLNKHETIRAKWLKTILRKVKSKSNVKTRHHAGFAFLHWTKQQRTSEQWQ